MRRINPELESLWEIKYFTKHWANGEVFNQVFRFPKNTIAKALGSICNLKYDMDSASQQQTQKCWAQIALNMGCLSCWNLQAAFLTFAPK